MKSPSFLLLLLFVILGLSPSAFAQENPSAPGVVAVAPAVPAAPAPGSASEKPVVTARKEEEEETKPAAATEKPTVPNEEQHRKTMGMFKTAAASIFGIPTETSQDAAVAQLTTENASLVEQVASLQADLLGRDAVISGHVATIASLTAQMETLSGQYAEIDAAFKTMIAAPAALLKKDAATLTKPEAAMQEAIVTAVSGEIRSVGQPAAKLPGPGSEPVENASHAVVSAREAALKDPKYAGARAAALQRESWSKAGYVPAGLDN